MRLPQLFTAIILFCVFGDLSSQDTVAMKTIFAERMSSTLVLDGLLDEQIWKEGEWSSDFVQSSPRDAAPPTFQTKYKIRYDDKYLYAGFMALDSAPDSIELRMSRRDGFVGDRINLILDSYNDKRTGFIFTITSAGIRGDEIVINNGQNIDSNWNPIWYGDAKITSDGWTAEMKIPLSQLRFGKNEEQEWGVNISRFIMRRNERSSWRRVPRNTAGFISESGKLLGIKGILPQRQLEIQPFVVGKYDYNSDLPPTVDKSPHKWSANVGLDAKIGVTNDLTLDLTLNPDFGQVEADPGAIALDGFQLFFAEQRPFFIENKGIFDFQYGNGNDNLFYSRRIGQAPALFNAKLPIVEFNHIEAPRNTTILGAAKFSGKTRNGWSIGLLECLTDNEYATLYPNKERIKINPLTNYGLVRIQKDFNQANSYIGGIVTSTIRQTNDNLSHTSQAFTGGIDFTHQWNHRNYRMSGRLMGSAINGSPESIALLQRTQRHRFDRIDADHLTYDPSRESMLGHGSYFEIGRAGGSPWTYNTKVLANSPGLELNDIGFLRRADEIVHTNEVRYKTPNPTAYFLSNTTTLQLENRWDFGRNHNMLFTQLSSQFTWKNNWSTSVNLGARPFIFDNTVLRGGPRFRMAGHEYINVFVKSNSARQFTLGLGATYVHGHNKAYNNIEYFTQLSYQPTAALSTSLNLTYNDNYDQNQFVTTYRKAPLDKPVYILGALNSDIINLALRVNYTINPNLSLQFYGSPFIATGTYDDFRYVAQPTAQEYTDRTKHFDAIDYTDGIYHAIIEDTKEDVTFWSNDFKLVQLRTNLVMRWEYIAGSELYLVWSQGKTRSGSHLYPLSDNYLQAFTDDGLNQTFLVKYTYRFIR